MEEHENHLTEEAIDKQTERGSSGLSQEDHRLIQSIHVLAQASLQEHARSLEHVWSRFMQTQEYAQHLQRLAHKNPGDIQKGRSMRNNHLQETTFPTLSSLSARQPGRSRWRLVSLSTVAAIVLLAAMGWALLVSGQRHGFSAPQTGVSQSFGTIQCRISEGNTTVSDLFMPSLDWSSSGQIVATSNDLAILSVQDCRTTVLGSAQSTQATWSPDGKRLLVISRTSIVQVLSSDTGKLLFDIHAGSTQPGVAGSLLASQAVWSPDGKRIVTEFIDTHTQPYTATVLISRASDGRPISMLPIGAIQYPGVSQSMPSVSPDGKYIAVQKTNNTIEIWNIESGKVVNTLPLDQAPVNALAWSPNGASLAIGLANTGDVQIWSIATGQRSATFTGGNTSLQSRRGLAWSPNGNYLAESDTAIHLWDTHSQKIVATFGQVSNADWISAVAWSLDNRRLAAWTTSVAGKSGQNSVTIWKLF